MKTFKTFTEQLVPIYKMGRNAYPKNRIGAPTTTNLPKGAVPDAEKKLKAKSKIKPFKRDRK